MHKLYSSQFVSGKLMQVSSVYVVLSIVLIVFICLLAAFGGFKGYAANMCIDSVAELNLEGYFYAQIIGSCQWIVTVVYSWC